MLIGKTLQILNPDWFTSVHLQRQMDFQPAKTGGPPAYLSHAESNFHLNFCTSVRRWLWKCLKRSLPSRHEKSPSSGLTVLTALQLRIALRSKFHSKRAYFRQCLFQNAVHHKCGTCRASLHLRWALWARRLPGSCSSRQSLSLWVLPHCAPGLLSLKKAAPPLVLRKTQCSFGTKRTGLSEFTPVHIPRASLLPAVREIHDALLLWRLVPQLCWAFPGSPEVVAD